MQNGKKPIFDEQRNAAIYERSVREALNLEDRVKRASGKSDFGPVIPVFERVDCKDVIVDWRRNVR